MSNIIMAIESSCDDTSVAIMQDAKILSLGVSGQKIHEKYGGVVPELASRAHLQHIVPLVDSVLEEAGIQKSEINAVAFTQGPGLLGSLLVGACFAKAFALARNIPLISVHHMEAHVMAHMIDDPKPEFPFLCLTVSGGHTQIVQVKSPFQFEVIGETLDDAAGEAFDKTGKMLGLQYPAGPLIDKYAAEGNAIFSFSKPKVSDFNYSFSGLKTGIKNFLRMRTDSNPEFVEENLRDICASVQNTIVEILLSTFEKAAKNLEITNVAIAGGVSANSQLRKSFINMAAKNSWKAYIPAFKYCTDNAGMIAMAGYYKYKEGLYVDQSVVPKPRFQL